MRWTVVVTWARQVVLGPPSRWSGAEGGLTAAELDRAVGYPYAAPAGSYVVDAGTSAVAQLAPGEERAWAGDRHAVLAVGSNGAPEQLVRKFGTAPGDRRIAVLAATVRDHDVAYAALVAHYGAIPAGDDRPTFDAVYLGGLVTWRPTAPAASLDRVAIALGRHLVVSFCGRK